MANAKPRDVQAGWAFYRLSGFGASLDEINQRLVDRGFNPISDRTYSHYRKLARYGYERYVPINQLDVETLRDPVWDAPLRSRFRSTPARVDVQVILLVDGDLVVLSGTTQEVSEAQTTILVRPSKQLDVLARARDLEAAHSLVVFADVDDAISAVIDLVAPADNGGSALLSLSFLQLVPAEDVSGRETLPSVALHLRVEAEDSQYFLNVVRELYAILEAVESTRLVCDEALAQNRQRPTIRDSPTRSCCIEQVKSDRSLTYWCSTCRISVLWGCGPLSEAPVDLAHRERGTRAVAPRGSEGVRRKPESCNSGRVRPCSPDPERSSRAT